MRSDTDPAAQLDEAMNAALFTHHSYGVPIIGWGHEIETLDRQRRARLLPPLLYAGKRHSRRRRRCRGAGSRKRLARETYGKIPARGEAPVRNRPREPEPRAERMVKLADEKVEQPQFERIYLVPSARTAQKGEAGGARRARPSSGRRPDQPALPQAGAGEKAGRHGRGLLFRATRSTRAASSSTPCRRRAWGWKSWSAPSTPPRRTRARRRQRRGRRPRLDPAGRRSGLRPGQPGVAGALVRRGAGQWRDRRGRVVAGAPASRRSRRKTSPRRCNGWSAAAPSPASCSRKKPPRDRR